MQKRSRSFLFVVAVTLCASPLFCGAAEKSKTYSLSGRRAPGSVDRVEAALEVAGDQKVMIDGKVKRFKMSVLANVAYDERLLEPSTIADAPVRSIRHYDKALVLLKLDNEQIRRVLSDERRLIGVDIDGPTVTLFSPHGAMTRDELDLVEMHGANLSLLAYHLLPEKPVAVGDSWKHSGDLVVAVLDLDAVGEADVRSVLSKVTGGTAHLDLSGRVEGAVGGVSTQIELKAKYQLNLATGRITWFGLLISENRSIGHIGPGLEAISRLQMKISPLEKSQHLDDSALADLSLEPTDQLTRLRYESPGGGWRFVHDRRWYIASDDQRSAVLRLIDRGEFVAQCNVHTLENAAPESQITLAEFQDDIKHGLGESFGQFVEASQRGNEADHRVYRVSVAGEVEQLPIQWIYYLVSDRHGRQVVFAFTVEGGLLDRFGQSDQQLLSTLRLADPKIASRPTTAE